MSQNNVAAGLSVASTKERPDRLFRLHTPIGAYETDNFVISPEFTGGKCKDRWFDKKNLYSFAVVEGKDTGKRDTSTAVFVLELRESRLNASYKAIKSHAVLFEPAAPTTEEAPKEEPKEQEQVNAPSTEKSEKKSRKSK